MLCPQATTVLEDNKTTELAEMMNKMTADMAIIANVCKSLDARMTALEEGKVVTSKVAKPAVQKPKASEPSGITAVEPSWVLDKRTVYSVPNKFISKKARYAFKMQSAECGGVALTEEERKALVKKTGDKYITARKFSTEKSAKEFFQKWA